VIITSLCTSRSHGCHTIKVNLINFNTCNLHACMLLAARSLAAHSGAQGAGAPWPGPATSRQRTCVTLDSPSIGQGRGRRMANRKSAAGRGAGCTNSNTWHTERSQTSFEFRLLPTPPTRRGIAQRRSFDASPRRALQLRLNGGTVERLTPPQGGSSNPRPSSPPWRRRRPWRPPQSQQPRPQWRVRQPGRRVRRGWPARRVRPGRRPRRRQQRQRGRRRRQP
jgi:hypothetical protein